MLIYRARKHLGERIVDTHSPQHPRNAWALPDWGTVETAIPPTDRRPAAGPGSNCNTVTL
jgi:hypothetical protein